MMTLEKEIEKIDAVEFYRSCVGKERLYFVIMMITAIVCTISICTGYGILAGISYIVTMVMVPILDRTRKKRIAKEQFDKLKQYKHDKL